MSPSISQDGEGSRVRTAVCCSGGGIRSASYCLGALEALAADNDGQQPDLVTAVSGGSYITAAGALAADEPQGPAADSESIDVGAGYDAGFKPGSLLETRIRDNTHYLVPDAASGLRGALSLLWGALGNMILIGSLVYVFSALCGWLLKMMGGLAWSGDAVTFAITAWQVWIPAGLGIAAGMAFLASRILEKPPEGARRLWTERLATWTAALLALGAAATVLLIAEPALFQAIWQSAHAQPRGTAQPGTGMSAWAGLALPVFAAGAAAFAKAAAGTISASWSRLGSGVQGKVRPWLAHAGRVLMPWLGSAFVLLALFTLSVYVLGLSSAPGYPYWEIAVAIVIFAVLHVLMDVNRSSMHDFYRDRLADAYADRARARSRMSQLAETPSLVICAAANLRTGDKRQRPHGALRGVPPGRGAVSFVFTPASTELHFLPKPAEGEPEPREDDEDGVEKANTKTYEDLLRPDRMTLFDLVAISGGAVAPLMGKMTSAAHRLLFGAVNLRLGIWLPRPSLVRLLDNHAKNNSADDHVTWQGKLPKAFSGLLNRWMLGWQMASWDRVRLHHQTQTEHAWWRPSCWGPAMLWRFWQPNLLLLWREVAGSNPVSAKWIYVSDGGHYDNLGLVEALRQHPHPTQIHLIDASGDAEHKYTGLGQAIALARSELGVEIHLDPGQMELPPAKDDQQDVTIPGRKPGILKPFATGTYEYTRGAWTGKTGDIDIIKLGVWAGQDLPWDVRAYYASHPTFPRDSTLKQLYDDEDFEAYRELGQASMRALLTSRKKQPVRVRIVHRYLTPPWRAPGPAVSTARAAPVLSRSPGV